MKINFARLNHLLIPTTRTERDRLRRTRMGKLIAPLWMLYEALTPEGAACSVAAVLSVAFSLDVIGSDAHMAWAGLTALLLCSLVLSRIYRLPGVRLSVTHARRVTVGDEMVFLLRVSNDGQVERQALRCYGPFLPWDGKWTGERPAIESLAPGTSARVELRARFSARGEHHLDDFRVAALIPLGLSQGPSVHAAGVKFLVTPRPANVVTVHTPAGGKHQPGGVLLASKNGESQDFCGVRPYRPGDLVRDLHVRSWARTGFPVVREYQQEYFSRIGVVLDTDLAAADDEVLEAALSLCAGVIARLCRGEALIDVLVVGDTVHPLTLGRSLGTLEQALDLLACVRPGPALSAAALLERLTPYLSRLSCVILVVLRWDDVRVQLAEQLRRHGAAVRTLLLTSGPAAATRDGPVPVPLSAIRDGSALQL